MFLSFCKERGLADLRSFALWCILGLADMKTLRLPLAELKCVTVTVSAMTRVSTTVAHFTL